MRDRRLAVIVGLAGSCCFCRLSRHYHPRSVNRRRKWNKKHCLQSAVKNILLELIERTAFSRNVGVRLRIGSPHPLFYSEMKEKTMAEHADRMRTQETEHMKEHEIKNTQTPRQNKNTVTVRLHYKSRLKKDRNTGYT